MLIDVDDVALGHESKMRWNEEADWVWSQDATHEAIIDVSRFEAAQDVFNAGQRAAIRKTRTRHPYMLSGLMRCGVCGRKMQASWNNKRAYYRCKFPAEYAVSEAKHPKTVYVRESAVVPGLDRWIAQLFDDDHLDSTCEALAAASDIEPAEDPEHELIVRRQIKDCDAKLAKYRQLLEQQPDVTSVGTWIAEVEQERKRLERKLGHKPQSRNMTSAEIKALVAQLRDIASVLADATPEDKRAVYDELGVTLSYEPGGQTVQVAAGSPHVLMVGVGGGT